MEHRSGEKLSPRGWRGRAGRRHPAGLRSVVPVLVWGLLFGSLPTTTAAQPSTAQPPTEASTAEEGGSPPEATPAETGAPPPTTASADEVQGQASLPHPRRRAREMAVEGLQHCAQEDFTTCRQRLVAASELWDGHYQFAYLLAQAEARSGRHDEALERIGRLTAAGYALPLAEDPAFEALRGEPRFQDAISRIERFAARPVVRGEVFAELEARDQIPEGLALDGKGNLSGDLTDRDLYVSSIRQRKIVRRAADGTLSDFADRDLLAVFGLAIDPRKRWLWATTGAVEAMAGFRAEIDGQTALVAYDLESGDEVARHTPPRGEGPGYRFNDLALDASGQVFTTDNRLDGGVWKLASDGSLSLLTPPGSLRSPQGITFDSEGRLFVADYSFGLARVDPETGDVVFLEEPAAVSLIGIDGLAAHGDTLIAIQNGARPIRILRVHLDESVEAVSSVEILEMGHPRWSEPTLGTVVGDDYLYVANSQWDRFDADMQLPPVDQLAAPLILRIDLR